MPAQPTEFHDSGKELKEYIVAPPGAEGAIDAVYCCQCVEESYCRLESNAGSFRAYAWGSTITYAQLY